PGSEGEAVFRAQCRRISGDAAPDQTRDLLMRAWLYWIAVALLIGAVSHLSYVLIAPSFAMQRLMGGSKEDSQINRFVLLDATEQLRLLGETPTEALSGKCIFDISKGELSVAAEMPHTF